MEKDPLYIQLYNHYKDLISLGVLKPGSKLPSIRQCANERMISKTTVEGAYLQLVAEGYISSRPGSGFYVSSLDYEDIAVHRGASYSEDYDKPKVIYDFASANVDYKTFNFSLWSKYIKHALRNEKRLISYGEPQGEYDLRVAICDYIEESRGVLCSPHQVIVGAGIQSLLHILCSLISYRNNVAFVNGSFNQGGAVFEDRGFKSVVYSSVDENLYSLKEENIKLIYTSPSHTTPWGDVMPINTRLKLLNFAKQEDALIIEEDDKLKKWFIEKCKEHRILIKDFYFKTNKNEPLILLSCSGVSSEEFYPAMKLLKEIIVKYLSPGQVIQVTGTCEIM